MKNAKRTKLWMIAVLVICLGVCGVGYGLIKKDQGTAKQERAGSIDVENINVTVHVSNGITEAQNEIQNIQIPEYGFYKLQLNYKPDQEGLLLGCMLYDENGQVIFFSTGDEMMIESGELELNSGTYTIEFRFLTNENDWNSFWEDAGEKYMGETVEFQNSGEWKVNLEYGIEKTEGYSTAYLLGMAVGILAGVALMVFLIWLIGKMGGKVGYGCRKGSYDERQMLARGQAYKVAFFTLMFYLFIVSFLSEIFKISLFMSFMGIWIGICFSITVFAIICIIKDAYMSLYENAKGIIMMFSVVALLNIIVGAKNIFEKCPIIEDGAISVECMNLVVGAMFCVIAIVFGGKLIYDKKHVEEEE